MKVYLIETGLLMKKEDFEKESEFDHYSTCYDKKVGYYDTTQQYVDKSDWEKALKDNLSAITEREQTYPVYCIMSVTDIDDYIVDSEGIDIEVEGEDYQPQNVVLSVKRDKDGAIDYNFIEGQQTDPILTLNVEHFMNKYLLDKSYNELYNLPANGSKVINMSVGIEATPVKVMFTKDGEYNKLNKEGKPDADYGNIVTVDFLYQKKNLVSTGDIHISDLNYEFDQILRGSTDYFLDENRTLTQIIDEAVEKEKEEDIER